MTRGKDGVWRQGVQAYPIVEDGSTEHGWEEFYAKVRAYQPFTSRVLAGRKRGLRRMHQELARRRRLARYATTTK